MAIQPLENGPSEDNTQAYNVWNTGDQGLVPVGTQAQQAQPGLTAPKPAGFSFGDVVGALFGGPAIGNMLRQRKIDAAMVPVYTEYTTKVNKALNAGDFDTAEALTTEFGKYADMSPRALQLQQTVVGAINAKRDKYAQVNGVVDLYEDEIGTQSGKAVLSKIRQNWQAFPSGESVLNILKNHFPDVKVESNRIVSIDKVTGRVNIDPTPQFLDAKDIPKALETALIVNGYDPKEYSDLYNAVASGKATSIQRDSLQGIRNKMFGPTGEMARQTMLERGGAALINTPPSRQNLAEYAGVQAPGGTTGPTSAPIVATPPITSPMPGGGSLAQTVPEQARLAQSELSAATGALPATTPTGQPGLAESSAIQSARRDIAYNMRRANDGNLPMNERTIARDAAIKGEENLNRLMSEARAKPTEPQTAYMQFKDGKLQAYQGEKLSDDEMNRRGYAALPQPQAKSLQDDYTALEGKRQAALDAIAVLPTDAKSNVYRAAGRFVASAQNIPLIGNIIPGSAMLGRAETRALTALSAYAQASEAFLNKNGKDNATTAAIKDNLVGYLSGPGSAKATIDDIKELTDNTVREQLRVLNPGAADTAPKRSSAQPSSWESQGDPLRINALVAATQQAMRVPEKALSAEGRASIVDKVTQQYNKMSNPEPGTLDALIIRGIKSYLTSSGREGQTDAEKRRRQRERGGTATSPGLEQLGWGQPTTQLGPKAPTIESIANEQNPNYGPINKNAIRSLKQAR